MHLCSRLVMQRLTLSLKKQGLQKVSVKIERKNCAIIATHCNIEMKEQPTIRLDAGNTYVTKGGNE